jgi:hypothetical protein
MSDDTPQRQGGSSLRGWLSDVFFPTLIAGPLEPLVTRLGGRSTVDHPLFGRASGLPPVETLLVQAREWLLARQASYSPVALVVGSDRDVAEGTLTLTLPRATPETEGATAATATSAEGGAAMPAVHLPVAVVAERRRSREVELRVYHATSPFGASARPRELSLRPQDGPVAPVLVASHLEALRKGDAEGVLACFESDGMVRDALATVHRHEDGGIREYYAGRYGVGLADDGAGVELVARGYADDGRACAIELTCTAMRGEPRPPHAMLAVYERGKSGLFHALRLYEEA